MPALTLAFIRFLLALGLLLLAASAIVPVRAEIAVPETMARAMPDRQPVAVPSYTEGDHPEAPTRFIEILGDVPLMDGLSVDESSALVFDKPEGRVIEIAATDEAGLGNAAISGFYDTALAQLGWLKTDQNRYVRMSEALEISFIQGDSASLVRFVLSPEKN